MKAVLFLLVSLFCSVANASSQGANNGFSNSRAETVHGVNPENGFG